MKNSITNNNTYKKRRKSMKKRLITTVLLISIMSSLAACGSKENTEPAGNVENRETLIAEDATENSNELTTCEAPDETQESVSFERMFPNAVYEDEEYYQYYEYSDPVYKKTPYSTWDEWAASGEDRDYASFAVLPLIIAKGVDNITDYHIPYCEELMNERSKFNITDPSASVGYGYNLKDMSIYSLSLSDDFSTSNDYTDVFTEYFNAHNAAIEEILSIGEGTVAIFEDENGVHSFQLKYHSGKSMEDRDEDYNRKKEYYDDYIDGDDYWYYINSYSNNVEGVLYKKTEYSTLTDTYYGYFEISYTISRCLKETDGSCLRNGSFDSETAKQIVIDLLTK